MHNDRTHMARTVELEGLLSLLKRWLGVRWLMNKVLSNTYSVPRTCHRGVQALINTLNFGPLRLCAESDCKYPYD